MFTEKEIGRIDRAADKYAAEKYASNAVVKRTPFDQIAETLDDANRLAGLVQEFVTRLVGAVPETASGALNQPVQSGVLLEYDDRASYTSGRIREAVGALNRLSEYLP